MKDVNGVRARSVRVVRMMFAAILVSYMCIPPSATYALAEGGVQDDRSAKIDEVADDGSREMQDASEPAIGSEGVSDGEGATTSADAEAAEASSSSESKAESSDAGMDSGAPSGESASEEAPGQASSEPGDDEPPALQDLTVAWEQGEARIDASGDYTLSADVNATSPLQVVLPEGATATVDLAGFDVEVGGDATSAIDLTRNAGHITFTDSAYDARHENDDPDEERAAAPSASVTLVAGRSQGYLAAIDAVLAKPRQADAAHARFEKLRISVEADADDAASFSNAVAAVRTGVANEKEQPLEEEELEKLESVVEFDTCAFAVKHSCSVSAEDLEEAGLVESDASNIYIICAESKGVALSGYLGARVFFGENGGETEADATKPACFTSTYANSYALGSNLELPDYLTFGFPEKAAGEDDGESSDGQPPQAIVASAEEDGAFPESVGEKLLAEPGYVPQLDCSDSADEAKGYIRLRLTAVSESGKSQSQAIAQQESPAIEGEREASVARKSTRPPLSAQSNSIGVQATGTDLNAAWKAQSGGFAKSHTISKGGTYYLSGDLAASNSLIIAAPNQAVTINLNDHVLSIAGVGLSDNGVMASTMIEIDAAKSVSFIGVSRGKSVIRNRESSSDVWAVNSKASQCALSFTRVTVELKPSSSSLNTLHAHAVRLSAGSLEMTDCKVDMDFGGQSLKPSSTTRCDEAPSAVYATNAVSAVHLRNCDITGIGSSAVSVSDLSSVTEQGNAYALYSEAGSTTVEGGTYRAASLRGNATALCASSLSITKPVSLEVGAGQIAAGVLARKEGGTRIGVPVSFSISPGYEGLALAECALRSSVEGGFVFGECVSGPSSSYPVLVMTDGILANANQPDMRIGKVSGAVAPDAVKYALNDALGASGSCKVAVDSAIGELVFMFDETRAVARVDATSYASLEKAANAFAARPGVTFTLLKDVDSLTIPGAAAGFVDLNGHKVSQFRYSAGGESTGLTLKNGIVGGEATAVVYDVESPFKLENVKVQASCSDTNVIGIHAGAHSGVLTLDDACAVDVQVSRIASTSTFSAIGVDASSGNAGVIVMGAAITARGLTVGTSAIGVRSLNCATLSDCRVTATARNSTAWAFNAAGSVEAFRTGFSAYVASSSSCAAVRLAASNPYAADVAFDECAFSAIAGVGVPGANTVCILGATSETGAVTPTGALKLKGSTTFKSTSMVHLGMNIGALFLDNGFSVSAQSDSNVVISQARNTDNVGASVADAMTAADMQAIAGKFEAKAGSYYEGFVLTANEPAHRLEWRHQSDPAAEGVVQLDHEGAETRYQGLGDAIAHARSGDTLTVLKDFSEVGAYVISQDDLSLDLGSHTVRLRSDAQGSSSSDGTGDAIRYTGTGRLLVKGGVLSVQVGALSGSSAVANQGLSVTGGGTLVIESDTDVRIMYNGNASGSSTQAASALRGIAVSNGNVQLDGRLSVTGAVSGEELGTMDVCGLYAKPSAAKAASIEVGAQATVDVRNGTAVKRTENPYYAEATSISPSAAFGLRELHVDAKNDKQFYDDLLAQFKLSASYDDPYDSTLRSRYPVNVYYAAPMVLHREGAWYDGLRVWAYSDEVSQAHAGEPDLIVPAHMFISTGYDELPRACGIASEAESRGWSSVTVAGAVNCSCPHGEAFGIRADDADGASMALKCSAAEIAASADSQVHPVAQGQFDLREHMRFPLYPPAGRVAPGATMFAKLVKYEAPAARAIAVGDDAGLSLEGSCSFSANGLDAAHIEASSFKVGDNFSLVRSGDSCTVADPSGTSRLGKTFAIGARAFQSALFEDALQGCKPKAVADGVAWAEKPASSIQFKVGDAIVARKFGAAGNAIALSDVSDKAKLSADIRQSYELVGWSKSPDETATAGYLDTGQSLRSEGSSTYYAVYATGFSSVPVTFTGAFDALGAPLPDVAVQGRYGQEVESVLHGASESVPDARGYTDVETGTDYVFVGWSLYEGATSNALETYSSDQVLKLRITVDANGMKSRKGVMLRAVYVPRLPGQHMITFVNESVSYTTAVDDGVHPTYLMANNTGTSSVDPSRMTLDTGRVYEFKGWFSDDDANGERSDAEACYTAVLPRATADATYTANWKASWGNVTYKFHVVRLNATTKRLEQDTVIQVDSTYDKDVQSLADSVAAIGSEVGLGSRVYKLKGWAVRKTDAEPTYDASNPLPTMTGGSIPADFATEYYGVYDSSDHQVEVAFYDGSKLLGTAVVSAASTSINEAFMKTRASVPADKSEMQSFIGWALATGADSALDGTATMIGSLVSSTASHLSLYAAYGYLPSYTVRLRDADGQQVLYAVSVKRGRTVNAVLAQAGLVVTIPRQTGKYFSGWRTAAGAFYDLDTGVTGSVNLYASYRDIVVSTAEGISATVTSTSLQLQRAESVEFSMYARDSADRPLRYYTSSNSYTILKNYDMRLLATDESGASSVITGDIGTVDLSVQVGDGYQDASVRAFWLGQENGLETVRLSDKKVPDSAGNIAVSLGDYAVGDADEGGNFCIGYIEGTSAQKKLDSKGSSASLNAASAKLSSLSSRALGAPGASMLASRTSSALNGKNSESASGKSFSNRGAGASNASKGGSDMGAAGSDGEEGGSGGDEPADVLGIVLAGLALSALVVWIAYRLLIVGPRNREYDVEAPALSETYARGIEF